MGAWSTDIDIEQGATFKLGFVYCDPIIGPTSELSEEDLARLPEDFPELADGEVAMQGGKPIPGAPKDLTDCTARMQVKKSLKDSAAVTATSEPWDPELVVDDVDGNPVGAGRIVLGDTVKPAEDPPTGRIDIILTDADTDAIDFTKGVYDLEVEYPQDPGEMRPRVERILEGNVTIDPNVTR